MHKLVGYVFVVIAAALLGQYGIAQERAKVYRIGFLGTPESLETFSKALSSLGYNIGQNVIIDARWPPNERLDQLPVLAEELVKLKVDVIVAASATAALAAKDITTEIPIVFSIIIDPVADGLVTNLGRPGGNITGVTVFDRDQAREQLALLKEVIPDLRRIAVLGDSGAALAPFQINEEAAHALAACRTCVTNVSESLRCYTGDGSRSPEVGLQEQASNRPVLLRRKGVVVSDCGKRHR